MLITAAICLYGLGTTSNLTFLVCALLAACVHELEKINEALRR